MNDGWPRCEPRGGSWGATKTRMRGSPRESNCRMSSGSSLCSRNDHLERLVPLLAQAVDELLERFPSLVRSDDDRDQHRRLQYTVRAEDEGRRPGKKGAPPDLPG